MGQLEDLVVRWSFVPRWVVPIQTICSTRWHGMPMGTGGIFYYGNGKRRNILLIPAWPTRLSIQVGCLMRREGYENWWWGWMIHKWGRRIDRFHVRMWRSFLWQVWSMSRIRIDRLMRVVRWRVMVR